MKIFLIIQLTFGVIPTSEILDDVIARTQAACEFEAMAYVNNENQRTVCIDVSTMEEG